MQQRRDLFDKLQTNAKNRLQGLKTDGETGAKVKSNVSYKGAGQMPKEDDVKKLRIFVGECIESQVSIELTSVIWTTAFFLSR